MVFAETAISGAYLVDLDPVSDERGFFARTWCAREFGQRGLVTAIAQCSLSYNKTKFTLRGMHYQIPPSAETKLVRCVSGAIYDVILDLRPPSASFKRWVAVELTSGNRRALYVPPGVAHGFMTVRDEGELLYQISEFYSPAESRGVRWDDPSFAIQWPAAAPALISNRDLSYPPFPG